MKTMREIRGVLGACVCAAVMALALVASAQTQWQGAAGVPGNWTNTSNWAGGVVPTADASIANNGIAEITTSPTPITNLWLQPGTLRINSGGEQRSATIYVSNGENTGHLEVNGGTLMGTNTSSLGANLYLGLSAGGTGRVAMTDGIMTLRTLRVGQSGSGTLVLSNGIVTVNIDHTGWSFIAGAAGGTGDILQYGGTLNWPYTVVFGSGAGARGRYVMNGGTGNVAYAFLGNAAGGSGELTVNGGNLSGRVYVAPRTGSTGTVVFANVTNTLTELKFNADSNPGEGNPASSSSASITFDNAVITNLASGGNLSHFGFGMNSTATALQNGGRVYWGQGIVLGSELGSVGTYTVTNNAVLASPNSGGVGITVGKKGTGQLLIRGGDVSTMLFVFGVSTDGGTGTVEMTSGSLTVTGFRMPDSAGPGFFYLKGGTLQSAYKPGWSSQFRFGSATAGYGPGTFIQTGGTVLVDTNSQAFKLGYGLYEISGGTLSCPAYDVTIENLTMPNVPALRVKGSAPIVNVRRFAATTNPFLLQFVLDKSPAHVTNINFKWDQAYRCGHLRMGVDGGVVLSQTNAFTLLAWPGWWNLTYDYLSRPDPNMWTEYSNAVTYVSRVALANGYKQADLDMKGTKSTSFAQRAKGHVTLANVQTNRLIEMIVRMALTPAGKSVSNLVADMVAAGYTNSAVEDSGLYNVKLAIPASNVVDKATRTPSYFIWDFTDPTTLATNATLTDIGFEYYLPPPLGTVITIR